MGSGHFLVEATDQLARWLVQAWATARPEDVQSKEVAEQDVHWARREVVRNCIYGVDLNPMAVELAKLSLWLTTVASNKPLSFLDHHLRCGNSLIGAELEKLVALPAAKAEEQPPIWKFVLKQHTDALLKKYSLMASLPDDSLRMVKWKEERFREIQESELSRRLRELANVWLSTYFGNKVDDDDYYELQNHLSPEKYPDWAGFREKEWFWRAQELGREKRFFHWEMEFPEAFNGEGRGFDVVIGNPPWINLFGLTEKDRDYFRQKYHSPRGKYDIYVVFVEKGLYLAANQFGMIIPNRFLRSSYGQSLREVLLKSWESWRLIEFASNDVFKGATTYPLILIRTASKDLNEIKIAKVEEKYPSIKNLFGAGYSLLTHEDFLRGEINSSVGGAASIKDDLMIPLSELVRQIGQGVYTGAKDVFVIKDPSIVEPSVVRPVVDGADLERFSEPQPNNYLIYPYIVENNTLKLLDLQGYPKTLNYLSSNKPELLQRKFWGQTIASANKRFYEIWNPSPFMFAPKILYAEIASSPKFTLDLNGNLACLKTCYCIILKNDAEITLHFLVALLNSKILFHWLTQLSPTMRGGKHYRFLTQYLERLPIRRISFTTPAPECSHLVEDLKALYQSGNFDEILSRVEACLPKDAEGNFIPEQEKSDVIHDLLAFLAEQMLEMNKQKQQEIKGFLGWLEGYVGAKVDDLSPKTKIQTYYDHDYDEFLAVLKKNRKKLNIDPSRREPAEALRAEFQASVDKLRPLRKRIERTDGLIDEVVYRLYGLNEEEIRVVEESRGSTKRV